MRLLCCLLLACLACTPLGAQELRNVPPTPHDFAWQWPLTIEPGEDLVGLTLTPEVYARLWADDLSDLSVFNSADEPVPLAAMTGVLDQAGQSTVPAAPLDVPMFRVPRVGAREAGERLRLIVYERGDGRLERVDTQVEGPPRPAPATSGPDLLLDLSALRAPVRALVFDFAPDSEPLNARVDVLGSRNLSDWTRLSSGQALVSLSEDGLKLERRRIEFADTPLPYLRLIRTDSDVALPVARIQAVRGRPLDAPAAPLAQIELNGHAEARSSGFVYVTDGPYPVERINVALGERNAAASVIVESRARADLPWRERARGSVFRLAGHGGVVESAPFEAGQIRDREWRVRTEPLQARAPLLTLGYRPDEFAFLTQGDGPFRLAAGSARAKRGHFPLHAVLVELRNTRGDGWLPTQARLGRGAELAGGTALAPRPDTSGSPTPMQWLLWGVLMAAAFTVVTMVLKLLRQSGA